MGTVRHGSIPDTGSVRVNGVAERFPWANSFFLSGGWGVPQGFRGELGYNFGSNVSLALSFGMEDSWSVDPGEGTLALIGTLRYPFSPASFTPYVLFGTGGTVAVFGGSDTYILLHLGMMVPLDQWMQLRPEAGVVFTNKHRPGRQGIPGDTSPAGPGTKFAVNLSIEFDLARIF